MITHTTSRMLVVVLMLSLLAPSLAQAQQTPQTTFGLRGLSRSAPQLPAELTAASYLLDCDIIGESVNLKKRSFVEPLITMVV